MARQLLLLVSATLVGLTVSCPVCGDENHKPEGNADMMKMMQYMMSMNGGMSGGGGMNYGGGGGMNYEEAMRREREQQEMEQEKIQEKFEHMVEKFREEKHHYAKTMLGEMVKSCQCQRAVMDGSPTWITDIFMKDSAEDMVSDDWEPKSGEDLKKLFFHGLFSRLCGRVHTFLQRVQLIATRVEAINAGVTDVPSTSGP